MLSPEQCILEYYRRIDSGDVDWVVALFAPEAVYHRADTSLEGLAAIEGFFRDRRKIVGVHKVEKIWSLEDRVICIGTWEGHGAAGDARHLGFADFWTLDADGRVTERRSYLAVGHQYVEA